jgi:hypothetical protein
MTSKRYENLACFLLRFRKRRMNTGTVLAPFGVDPGHTSACSAETRKRRAQGLFPGSRERGSRPRPELDPGICGLTGEAGARKFLFICPPSLAKQRGDLPVASRFPTFAAVGGTDKSPLAWLLANPSRLSRRRTYPSLVGHNRLWLIAFAFISAFAAVDAYLGYGDIESNYGDHVGDLRCNLSIELPMADLRNRDREA